MAYKIGKIKRIENILREACNRPVEITGYYKKEKAVIFGFLTEWISTNGHVRCTFTVENKRGSKPVGHYENGIFYGPGWDVRIRNTFTINIVV